MPVVAGRPAGMPAVGGMGGMPGPGGMPPNMAGLMQTMMQSMMAPQPGGGVNPMMSLMQSMMQHRQANVPAATPNPLAGLSPILLEMIRQMGTSESASSFERLGCILLGDGGANALTMFQTGDYSSLFGQQAAARQFVIDQCGGEASEENLRKLAATMSEEMIGDLPWEEMPQQLRAQLLNPVDVVASAAMESFKVRALLRDRSFFDIFSASNRCLRC